MKIEQAIEVIKAYDMRNALVGLNQTEPRRDVDDNSAAFDLALTALKEKQEREKGCEYCKGKHFSDRQALPMSDYEESVTHEVGIDTDNALYITPLHGCVGSNIETLPINYCPMCGRDLEVSNG